MTRKEIVEQARELLPEPDTHEGNYIDIKVETNAGEKQVVTFTKAISDLPEEK